jgi:hypothetical protein
MVFTFGEGDLPKFEFGPRHRTKRLQLLFVRILFFWEPQIVWRRVHRNPKTFRS